MSGTPCSLTGPAYASVSFCVAQSAQEKCFAPVPIYFYLAFGIACNDYTLQTSCVHLNVFVLKVDVDDLESLERAFKKTALVVHCAGPFQRKEGSLVLEAAIATK